MRRMKRSGRKAEILVTVTAAVLLGAVLLLTGCAAREGGAIHPIALEAVQALTEIAAQQTVGELQQTLAGAMKGASADGKLTAEQVAQLRKELLERTEKKLTAPAVNLLRAAQLDVSALICGAAEDAIARMKKGEA